MNTTLSTYLIPVRGRRSTAATTDTETGVVKVAAVSRDGALAQVRHSETVVVRLGAETVVYDEFTVTGRPQRIRRPRATKRH